MERAFSEGVAAIRLTNPNRPILIGVSEGGGLGGLNKLILPSDPNLIVTIHYYNRTLSPIRGQNGLHPVPPVGVEWLIRR